MPIPEQRDLESARGIIAAWLAEQLPDAHAVEVGPISGPSFTGFSNETLLFDASWTTADGEPVTEALVLRVKPTQHTVFLEADFESQYRVLRSLGEHTAVPVPRVRWFEEDASHLGAPFFVMDAVSGRAPTDTPPYTMAGWLIEESTPAQRRTLVENGVDALCAVHAVDWQGLGFEFLDKPQYGALGFEQQLRYYEASFAWADPSRPAPPVAQATLEWVRAHAPADDPEITLCWGDARINNQLFDDDYRVAAVLDWEMVTLADPMMDLGWWLFVDRHFHEGMPAPRMEGFPTREEIVARYEATSGRVARDLEFYEIFGGLRFAVVMMRLGALLTEFEILPVDSDMADNNAVTRVLADMLGIESPRSGARRELVTPGGFTDGIVDTMVGLPPAPGDDSWRDLLRPLLKDRESLEGFAHPASYMFKNLPDARFADDPIRAVLAEMDRFGVERALVGVSRANEPALTALREHPDRLSGAFDVDPNAGVAAVRDLRQAVEEWGVVAASAFAAGTFPQRAYDEAAWFPVYAACVELDIPIFLTVGVPGPRVPFAPQRVETLDVVCYEFPDLVVVMRHGAEPWADLAVKLMLKWPGLHYSTSAFAPRYYPQPIIDFANTRGSDRVIFAGYFPMGLSYDAIFEQLPAVAFRDHVWPRFLRDNALRVLHLDG